MPVQCVTFDLDDTLWAIGPVIASADNLFFQWVRTHHPRVFEVSSEEEIKSERQAYYQNRPELHHDLWRLRRNWMSDLVLRAGYPEANMEEAFRIFWRERNNVTFYENAVSVLEATNREFSTGAITNGNADLDEIGISSYFNFFLTSAEIGVCKPDPAIFEAAIDQANCNPENIVHVGDDPERDVRGAARMGMRTIWINTTGQDWEGEYPPDVSIPGISLLPQALEKIRLQA